MVAIDSMALLMNSVTESSYEYPCLILNIRIRDLEYTGCLKKNARLRLEAYNSSLEAAIGTCRDIFRILRFSAFI